MVDMCGPKEVRWCDGSKKEWNELCSLMVEQGSMIKLNEKKRPNSFLVRSDPRDVARVESRTFICSYGKDDAGPTNNWEEPRKMRARLKRLFKGCMEGRVMYVIPFCMGPLGSTLSQFGVQVTDSPTRFESSHNDENGQTRVGSNGRERFFRALSSFGRVSSSRASKRALACDPDNTYIVHFPNSARSFPTAVAMVEMRCWEKSVWLCELILHGERQRVDGRTYVDSRSGKPEGDKTYVAGAFPSACGKTNMAMLIPPDSMKGWKVSTVETISLG